jgi:MobA/MobL family
LAIYHLNIKSISRGAGRSATAAAAYRAGERIRDERTGLLHNYSRRTDVSHKEILLPSNLQGPLGAWATERANLWNAAERAERQRNSRVAREYQVALPAELNHAQRLQLARTFSGELANRHNVAIDLAVHAPRPGGDARNHHAHLLATSREVTATGFGAKAGLDMASEQRQRRGLPVGIAEIKAIRERWAALTNEALLAAGLEVRVSHRSLRALSIDREAKPHIPFAAIQMERRGQRSEIADRIRERYRARVQARLARTAEPPSASSRSGQPDLEQVRRQAREDWLRLRTEAACPADQPQPYIKESSRASQLPGSRAPEHNPAAEQHRAAALERDPADRDFAL